MLLCVMCRTADKSAARQFAVSNNSEKGTVAKNCSNTATCVMTNVSDDQYFM